MVVSQVAAAPSEAAGKGIAAQPAAQIVNTALATVRAATSFAIDGTISDSGQTYRINVDLSVGHGSSGTIGFNGQVIHLVELSSNIYFSASKSFWQKNGGTAAAQLFAGRWVVAPATNTDLASFGEFLDPHQFVDQLLGQLPSGSTFRKGRTSTLAGHPVIAVTSTEKGNAGTVYVATAGPSYIIRISGGGGSSGTGSLNFSRYNQAVHVTAPKNAINYDQLTGGSS
jgi:hypothetical protein